MFIMGVGKNERFLKFNFIDFFNNEIDKYEKKLETWQAEQAERS